MKPILCTKKYVILIIFFVPILHIFSWSNNMYKIVILNGPWSCPTEDPTLNVFSCQWLSIIMHIFSNELIHLICAVKAYPKKQSSFIKSFCQDASNHHIYSHTCSQNVTLFVRVETYLTRNFATNRGGWRFISNKYNPNWVIVVLLLYYGPRYAQAQSIELIGRPSDYQLIH